jgi:hypothetical protein
MKYNKKSIKSHIKRLVTEGRDDIKRNWVDVKSFTTKNLSSLWPKSLDQNQLKENTNMSINLLLLYEIADKASRVKTKKAFKEFEAWVRNLVSTYHDAAIERVANIHLFQLRNQFSF